MDLKRERFTEGKKRHNIGMDSMSFISLCWVVCIPLVSAEPGHHNR
jgi:hypothetical protein